MQSRILFLALGASLLGGQSAIAQDASEKKLYVDLGYSRLGTDLLTSGDEFDVEFGAISARGGYQFTRQWSVEGEALLGVEDDDRSIARINEDYVIIGFAETKLEGLYGLYAKRDFAISEKLSAFGRIGATILEGDTSSQYNFIDRETTEITTLNFGGSDYEYGSAVGLGLSYDLSDKLYLRTDLTRVFLDQWEMDSANFAIGVRF